MKTSIIFIALNVLLGFHVISQPLATSNPYYVGHSLVNNNMPWIANSLAASGSKTSEYAAQVINGAPIRFNYQNPSGTQPYNTALATGNYDAFIITEAVPLLNHTTWSETYSYANQFLTYARAYSPDIRYFIYETWHCINTGLPARCDYDNDDGLLWEPRLISDFPKWAKIVDSVKTLQNYANVFMIPAGQAMHALAAEITAGNVPGFTSYRDLFEDDIHLTNTGNYFVACVMFSCIFRESPEGLTNVINDEWGNIMVDVPSEVALKMQQVAWSVVCGNPYSGVDCSSTNYTLNVTATNGSVTKNPNASNYTSGSPVTLTATPNSGYTFAGWSGDASGTNNPITVTINANMNIAANFTISAPSPPTVTSPLTYCENATASALTATGDNLLWYTVATGGTSSATPPTPPTTAAGTTTFYVSQTIGAIESERAEIVVTVNAIPSEPTVTTPITYPQGSTATALTASGSNLLWYAFATDGTSSATPPTPSTSSVGTTNYYVSQTINECESARALIEVDIEDATVTQTIALDAGWNLVSLYVAPSNSSVDSIFASILSQLDEIKNAEGFYKTEQAANLQSLTQIALGSSYLVKMKAAQTLTVKGTVPQTVTVLLKHGWNMLGYPVSATNSTATVLSTIWADTQLIKNFDAFLGHSSGTLNIMTPGEGYYIFMNDAAILGF
jgi:uncharacterized repeat protein (TIGR02543 family)